MITRRKGISRAEEYIQKDEEENKQTEMYIQTLCACAVANKTCGCEQERALLEKVPLL